MNITCVKSREYLWPYVPGGTDDINSEAVYLEVSCASKSVELARSCISIVPSGSNQTRPWLNGRVVQRDFIDFDLARNWITLCEEHHHACMGKEGQKSPSMVIDVLERRICKSPKNCRYLALSYVWSAKSRTMAVTSSGNEFTLEKDEAGTILPSKLPPTIEDAITFVRNIEERYL